MEILSTLENWIKNLGLSDYGSLASLISLLISAITLLLVKGLKKHVLFGSRIEEHSKSLGEMASNIASLLTSFVGNEAEIDQELAIADVKLRNIQKGASGDLLSDVKRARKRIRKFRWRYRINLGFLKPEEKTVRQAYTDINIVVEELINVKKELLAGK